MQGIHFFDRSRLLPAPQLPQQMVDFGAEVIKLKTLLAADFLRHAMFT